MILKVAIKLTFYKINIIVNCSSKGLKLIDPMSKLLLFNVNRVQYENEHFIVCSCCNKIRKLEKNKKKTFQLKTFIKNPSINLTGSILSFEFYEK